MSRARDTKAFANRTLLLCPFTLEGLLDTLCNQAVATWLPLPLFAALFPPTYWGLSPLSLSIQPSSSARGLEKQLTLTAVHAELIYLAGVALRQGRGRLNGEAVKKLIA